MNSILILEDDSLIQAVLRQQLGKTYSLTIVSTIAEGREVLSNPDDFDLILADVHLKDGESHTLIKEMSTEETHFAVLFMSGDDSSENRLACYEAGADDFISKPYAPAELALQVKNLLAYQESIKTATRKISDKELKQQQQIIQLSMMQSSSYGIALQLINDLNKCHTEEQMSRSVLRCLKNFGFNSSVAFHHNGASNCFDLTNGICSPIEQQLFGMLKDQGRIYRFNNRLIFNDTNVSVLIKNAPEEGSADHDVHIDLWAALIESIQARYEAYLNEQVLIQAQQTIKSVIDSAKETIYNAAESQVELIDHIMLDLKLSFSQLDLTEDQEEYLADLIGARIKEDNKVSELLVNISNELTALAESLPEEKVVTEEQGGDGIDLFADDDDGIDLF